MKVLAFSICMAIGATASAQNVTDQLDRFTGQRKIEYTHQAQGASFGKAIPSFFIHQGGDTPISAVRFMISPEPGRYAIQSAQFVGCRTIDWLVDDKPLKLGMVVHDLKRFDRLLVEFLTQEASLDQLAAIGNAQRVEYRICGKEGSLDPVDIAAVRDMVGRANGAAPALPPTPAAAEPASGSNWRSWGKKQP